MEGFFVVAGSTYSLPNNQAMNFTSSRRSIVILGGAGFVGSHWAHHLLSNTDASVHIFDNVSGNNAQDNLRWLHKCSAATNRLRVTLADVRDSSAVDRAVSAASEIYHFAAQGGVTTSLEDPRTDFEVNACGTLNVIESARRSGNRPFLLFTSTNKVYGHVRAAHAKHISFDRNREAADNSIRESQALDFYSPHGCSKGTADQYVHDYARVYGIPTVVFRMSCIAGPRQLGNEDQGWFAHFVSSALRGKTISIYGNGHQIRDVLAVQDLVRAFVAAYEKRDRTAGQVYNVGGGGDNTVSLLGLIELIESSLHLQVKHRFRPVRPGDQSVYVTNFGKFARHTNWLPERSIEQIIHDIGHWYKNNETLFSPAHFPLPTDTASRDAIREIAS